jgi:hypothetical protein
VVPVVEVGLLEEREAAIAKMLGRRELPAVLRRMLKLRARMEMVLQDRGGREQYYALAAGHQQQA